jgi:hypothetical protein
MHASVRALRELAAGRPLVRGRRRPVAGPRVSRWASRCGWRRYWPWPDLGRLGLPEVISVIHPENRRSQRVASKLGMAAYRRIVNPVLGIPVDIWHQLRPAC